jgi:hypothetical protein
MSQSEGEVGAGRGFDLLGEVRAIVRDEVRKGVELVAKAVTEGRERRVTLQEFRGGTARANAAYERRHPELCGLAVVVARRRMYLKSDLERHFGKAVARAS